MGATITGSDLQTGVTTIGNGVTVQTGVSVATLPGSSPVTIISSGTDSGHWTLSGAKIVPATITNKLGLGTVDTAALSGNYLLMLDTSSNEVKKIATTAVATAAHTQAWSTITGTPTTLSGYGISDTLQPLDADLTAIAALSYSSTSFLKKTAANTWALDTNTYAQSSHTHSASDLPIATLSTLGVIKVGSYLTIDANGVLNGQAGGTGGGGVWGTITGTLSDQTDLNVALGLKATIASPTFTGTVTIPTPFTLGATSVTTTAARLNYLTSAGGTTGTTSTNIVFSTSPVLTTPNIGAATGTSLTVTGDIIAYSA